MLTLTHSKPQQPKRVVILGARGFLGRNLEARLKGNVPVVPLGSAELDLASPDAGSRLGALLLDGDVLVFLSALTPDKGRDSATLIRNLEMARAVAAATKAVKLAQLIYASSDAVYPFDEAIIFDNTPAAPADLYGVMHRAREIILSSEAAAPLAILRFTAIYGSGDTHNSYGPNRFMRQAMKDKKIPLFGGGEETRDHLHVDDAVAVIMGVIGHGATGLSNVASGNSASFIDVARQIGSLAGNAAVETSERKSPTTHRAFDIANLLAAFPNLRMTPLASGLAALRKG